MRRSAPQQRPEDIGVTGGSDQRAGAVDDQDGGVTLVAQGDGLFERQVGRDDDGGVAGMAVEFVRAGKSARLAADRHAAGASVGPEVDADRVTGAGQQGRAVTRVAVERGS